MCACSKSSSKSSSRIEGKDGRKKERRKKEERKKERKKKERKKEGRTKEGRTKEERTGPIQMAGMLMAMGDDDAGWDCVTRWTYRSDVHLL